MMTAMHYSVTFEKIVSEGKAMAFWNGKALFCAGPLPGETAVVAITREKKRWAEARLIEITTAAPERSTPQEAHYMACSPWQGVAYDTQINLKRQILEGLFARPELGSPKLAFKSAPEAFGYRTKLELSLIERQGRLELGFHERGSADDFVDAPEGCLLGSAAMNQAALDALHLLRGLPVSGVAEGLTVRQGADAEIVVIIRLSERMELDWEVLGTLDVAGIAVIVGPRTGAVKTLYTRGTMALSCRVGDVEISMPWGAFTQVNPAGFELALADIMTHLTSDSVVADIYGGAGSIGLAIAARVKSVVGIETVSVAVNAANASARRLNITNYEAHVMAAEALDPGLVLGVDVVIVDPPRAGLTEKVIDYLLEARPPFVLYLSCNPVTQVRDIGHLAAAYEVREVTGYDFFPGTLHMEALALLVRK